ncbi:MAG: hypothetical protein J6L86_00150 [Alphaproteobacteria bacterium]|nr:hypothetical protein [Alphaproteobacteria bacterium]
MFLEGKMNNRLLRPLTHKPYVSRNPVTGLPVASCLEEFYPLAAGSVRLLHRTTANHISSIVENGLIYNSSALKVKSAHPDLRYNNARCIVHDVTEDEFWQVLAEDKFKCGATANADILVVLDMPAEEFYQYHLNPQKAYQKSAGAVMGGVISNRYLTGVVKMPNRGKNSPQYSAEDLADIRKIVASRPPLSIEQEKNWRCRLQKYNFQNQEKAEPFKMPCHEREI